MRKTLNQRERGLLGRALDLYKKLGTATRGNLEKLALSSMVVDVALGQVEIILTRLASPGNEIALEHHLRATARDALGLMLLKAEKVKENAELLLFPTEQIAESEYEVDQLRRKLNEQMEAFDDTTVEVKVGDKSSGKVPVGEMKRRMKQMEEQPRA